MFDHIFIRVHHFYSGKRSIVLFLSGCRNTADSSQEGKPNYWFDAVLKIDFYSILMFLV
jgi:hypothetical protein